jgi:hypothetical protein
MRRASQRSGCSIVNVSGRLRTLDPRRVTLDFDGSVISTGLWTEGTAVGSTAARREQRSYYPLSHGAPTAQVFDFLHRPRDVHDSSGAEYPLFGRRPRPATQ